MRRQLTRPALTALACLGIWALGLLFMWIDFNYGSRVWKITAGQILLLLTLMVSAPVFVIACIVMLVRGLNGRPALMQVVAAEELAPLSDGAAPDDPVHLLRNPPDGAQAMQHNGRRVVVLPDGSAIGHMLNGSARRFSSLDDYRSFVGS